MLAWSRVPSLLSCSDAPRRNTAPTLRGLRSHAERGSEVVPPSSCSHAPRGNTVRTVRGRHPHADRGVDEIPPRACDHAPRGHTVSATDSARSNTGLGLGNGPVRLFRSLFLQLSMVLFSLTLPAWADKSPSFDARLSGYDYPWTVENFAFESQRQSLEMAYMHLPGDPEKPTVLLLHGKNFAADYWRETAKFLNGRGYPVLMPDQIGFGKSSKPAHYQFSFEALAANTRALTEELNIDQVIVMGHSMGGMLAGRYALRYPDQVRKLVLVNPVGLEDYLDYVQYRDPQFFYENELNKTADKVIAYQKKNYYDGQWSPEYEALTTIHKGWINGPDWPRVAWNNALTYDMIFTGAVINEFGDIDVPTHLIIGTRDTTGPGRGWKKPGEDYQLGRYDRLGKRAADRIPDATLYELEDVGHMPQFEARERYEGILREIF